MVKQSMSHFVEITPRKYVLYYFEVNLILSNPFYPRKQIPVGLSLGTVFLIWINFVLGSNKGIFLWCWIVPNSSSSGIFREPYSNLYKIMIPFSLKYWSDDNTHTHTHTHTHLFLSTHKHTHVCFWISRNISNSLTKTSKCDPFL